MALPPVVAVLTANTAGFKAGIGDAKKELAAFNDSNKSSMTAASNLGGLAFKGLALGALGVGGASLKMAGDYQQSVTALKTGAGESEDNLGKVSAGMLNLSTQVGTGAKTLSDGMYLVESAGYHGADGLAVLKAAAEGAKVGNADLKTVADGVTTALTDYQLPAGDAAKVTSQLVTAVSLGKTTMGDLSGALSNVLPSASKAGLGLDQVLGAMSTMTAQGISADQASQDLNSTIASLQNPSSVASKAMAQMGLNSTEVAKDLGKNGLTGTMANLSEAILKHMGPDGLVLQNSFNQSALAAQSAKQMLSQLPASLRTLGQGYLDGTVSQKDWMKALKDQPAMTANLGRQFATTAKQAHGFSDQLKSGKGDAATFNAIMSEMTGGQTGLATSLALTGGNLDTFNSNAAAVSSASADASGNVKDWSDVQKDFNFKLDDAKAGAEKLGIQLGSVLIPVVDDVIKDTETTVSWFGKHKGAADTLGVAIGLLAGGFITVKAVTMAMNTYDALSTAITEGRTLASYGLIGATYATSTAAKVVTVAQWAWNAAMDANPIGLIIIGIAALIAGIVLLVTHWKTVKQWGVDAWQGIKDGWSEADSFFARIGDDISGPFKSAFNWVAGAWNRTIGSLSVDLPGVGHIGMPKIPMLATGTPYFSGGLAIVGEQGPELVKLPNGSAITNASQTRSLMNRPDTGGNGGLYIDKFYAGSQTPDQIASALAFGLRTK